VKLPRALIARAIPHSTTTAPKPRKRAGGVKVPPQMNKTEKAYSYYLWLLSLSGKIESFEWAPPPLLLHDCKYHPDFRVKLPDGRTRYDEVKGGHVWEDSVIKFKWAAQYYPEYGFRMVQRKTPKGPWVVVREYPKPAKAGAK
jgi:hypothetical protein